MQAMRPPDPTDPENRKKPPPYAVAEFQPVIFAGGSFPHMYPLHYEIPKPLLPVANMPLLFHVLRLLEKAGFSETIVVVDQSHHHAVKTAFNESYDGEIVVDFFPVSVQGSADALRLLKDKIKTDFLVLSCDLLTEGGIHPLLDMHRVNDATVTSFMYTSTKELEEERRRRSEGSGERCQYVGVDSTNKRLVYLRFSDEPEEQSLSLSMLNRFPNIQLHSNLYSGHLYVFKRWVLDLVMERKTISLIERDLVPFLVKAQVKSPKSLDQGQFKISHLIKEANPQKFALEATVSSNLRTNGDDSLVRCFVYVNQTGYTTRVNTVPRYIEANRQFIRTDPGRTNDNIMGEGTKSQTIMKRTVVGKNCTIGKNCRITGSVIMDNVQIEDRCKIEGSVICHSAVIQTNSTLVNCEVGVKYVVEKGTNSRSEQLVNVETQ